MATSNNSNNSMPFKTGSGVGTSNALAVLNVNSNARGGAGNKFLKQPASSAIGNGAPGSGPQQHQHPQQQQPQQGVTMTEHNRHYLSSLQLLHEGVRHYKIAPSASTLCWRELQEMEHKGGGGQSWGDDDENEGGNGTDDDTVDAWTRWTEIEEKIWLNTPSLQALDRTSMIATMGANTRNALRDSTTVVSSFGKLLGGVLAEVGCSSQAEALSAKYSQQYKQFSVHSLGGESSMNTIGNSSAVLLPHQQRHHQHQDPQQSLGTESVASSSSTMAAMLGGAAGAGGKSGGGLVPLGEGARMNSSSSTSGFNPLLRGGWGLGAGGGNGGGGGGLDQVMTPSQYQAPSFLPQATAGGGDLPSYSQNIAHGGETVGGRRTHHHQQQQQQPVVGQKRSWLESEMDCVLPNGGALHQQQTSTAAGGSGSTNAAGVFVPEALADQTARLMEYLAAVRHQQSGGGGGSTFAP